MTRKMKDSGVEWIGDIPARWDLFPTKRFFNNIKTIVGDRVNEYERLALTMNGVIKRAKDDSGGLQPEKFDGYQILMKNELVFKLIDLENVKTSRVGISEYNGIVSPAYIVLTNNQSSNKFFYYYFMFMYYNEVFNKIGGNGVRSSLNARELLNIPMVSIEEKEQICIANYLEDKCIKIDETIEKEKKAIEKLKKYKQATITEAVTKGLNHSVKLKKTVYFWVGEVPKEWTVGKLKYFATIRSGLTLGKKYSVDTRLVEYPYLRVANVQGDHTDLRDVATILIPESEAQKYKLQAGEVLMTEGGDRDKLGRGCVWHGEINECLHQNHVFAVKTNIEKLNPQYFDYVTTSDIARIYFDFTAKKTTNLASTNSTTILEFSFPIPPIDEQYSIIKYLDKKCSKINSVINQKEKLIEKLTEYKKSLIYECVTGKREV